MEGLGVWFETGGPLMRPLAVIGLLAVAGTLIALIALRAKKAGKSALYTSIALCVVATLLLALGAAGYLLSMRSVHDALTYVSAGDREAILSQGTSEAMTPVVFALWLSLIPLGAGVGVFGLGYVRFIEWRQRSSPGLRYAS